MMSLRQAISRVWPVWWAAAFVLGNLTAGAGSLALSHGVASSALHDVSGVSAAVAIGVGIAWYRPRPLAPWTLVGLGILLLASGDIAYEADSTGRTLALFSVGDWLYLAGYVAMAVALAWFGCRPRHSRWAGRMVLVDAIPVFLGSFLLLWFLVFNEQFDGLGLSANSRILVGAFPTFDLLLLALGARLLLTGAARLPSFGLLLAGIFFGFLGDLIWRGFLEATSYQSIWVNASYYLSYALIGAAALHPSMRLLTSIEVDEARVMPVRRLILLGGALATVPVVALSQPARFDLDDRILFGVAATVIPVLVIYRLLDLALTARRLGKTALESASRLEAVLDASPLPIAVVDANGNVERWNDAAEATSGWRAADVVGKRWHMHAAQGEHRVSGIERRALAGERLDHVELALRRNDGAARRVEVSTAPVGPREAPDAVIAVFDDVTDERRHEDEVRYLADHDPLTGLLNRRRFSECLLEEIVAADASGTPFVVAIADLDHFKEINDTAGHAAGDRMLCDLAGLIAGKLRPDDVCARLSGDEFALLLRGASIADAVSVGERILTAVRDYRLPLDSEHGTLDITLSIGLSPIKPGPNAESCAETVLLHADLALYEAKARGRNRSAVWTPTLAEIQQLSVRRGWSTRIKDALRDERFVIHLQPIVDLRVGRIAYHEALTRMTDENGKLVSPAEFLPHAADLGVIDQIDQNAIDRAIELLERDPELRIFVNLDTQSFYNETLLDGLEGVFTRRPHLAGRLGIEITERAPLRDYDRAQQRLTTLRGLGCLVAIDDFGTGFSSFEHLRRLPAHFVKVDARFVDAVKADPVSEAILEGIVNTAHALSMKVIAEGIETHDTVRLLGTRNIEYGQGYLYGRPCPPVASEPTFADLALA